MARKELIALLLTMMLQRMCVHGNDIRACTGVDCVQTSDLLYGAWHVADYYATSTTQAYFLDRGYMATNLMTWTNSTSGLRLFEITFTKSGESDIVL